MILNFDRGHGQNSEQMVQSLMESTQLAFDTLERKLGLSGGSLIDDDGNVVTVTKLVNKSTDKIEANYLAVKGELYASEARIVDLEAANVTINDKLKAHDANIDNLETNIARIDTLETGKADIDLANVNNAWISNGVIKDASIANEKVISVSANKLTAGTIDASKITVTNLNADNITVGTINGARIGDSSIDLDKLSQEVPTKEYLDSVEKKLQEEIDGAIETFTVSDIPTLNNEPAVNWTTDDIKAAHVGDLCYVVNSSSDNDGFCYRFQYNGTVYSWALIKDNDVTKAIQDIAELGGEVTQFKTDYTSKVSEIDGGIESLKSRTTAIETSVSTKVETSVFNTLKNTVDENSANITSLAETVTTKADSSTVTTLSNTVNEVKQTADANSSSISSLTTTVNSKADGSKVTELETKTSTIEQNLNGVATRVTNVEKDMATEEFVTSQGYLTVTSDAITSKVSKDEVISAINQTAESVSIDASKINLNGAVTFTSFDSSLQTTINNKAETSDLETVRTTANNAQTSINNLEIGGRNLVSNIDSNWQAGHWTLEDGLYAQYAGRICTKSGLKVSPGETYAIKIYLDSVTDRYLLFRTYGSDGSFIGSVANVTNLIYTVPSNVYELRFVIYENVTLDDLASGIVRVKVEKGNKATDWTPAPEDVDAGISAAQDNALSAQEATDALDDDFNNFKSNEYSQINDEVGELVNYKDENEKVISNIKDELSKELVAQKFARIENGSLILGEIDNTTAILTNAQFGFYAPNSEIPASYFGKDGDAWAFSIERGIVTNDLRFNGFQWISRANRNMSLKWLE